MTMLRRISTVAASSGIALAVSWLSESTLRAALVLAGHGPKRE